MSNAMRTGKRWLAGAAAGALGAGMLIGVVAAPSAQATTVSIAQLQPGLAIVKPSSSNGVVKQLPLSFQLIDENGVAANVASPQSVSVSITSVPAGVAAANGNSFSLDPTGATTDDTVFTNLTPTGTGGTYTFWIQPNTGSGVTSWQTVPNGNYTIRVRVSNSTTGGVIDSIVPVIVYANGTVPAASIRVTQNAQYVAGGAGRGTVNAASGTAGDTASNQPAFAYLTDANGFPIVRDDTFVGTLDVATSTTAASDRRGGFTNLTGADDSNTSTAAGTVGLYSFTPAGGTWAAGNNGWNFNYATSMPTAASAEIPLTIASASSNLGTTASTVLTTTPQNAAGTAVPAGTTALTFVATLDDTTPGGTTPITGTVAWTARTSAPGGVITPSSGIAAIGANNTVTVTVNLNAAAAADTRTITFVTGNNSLTPNRGYSLSTITQQAPVPAITASSPIVAKVGSPVTLTGAITDQFGRPLSQSTVVAVNRTSPSTSATLASTAPAANGTFSLTIPATSSPTAAAEWVYRLTATSGDTQATPVSVSVDYTATGDVSTLAITPTPATAAGQVPTVTTPGSGSLSLAGVSTATTSATTPAAAAPTGTNGAVTMRFVSSPATTISVSGSAGMYASTSTTGTALWNGGTDIGTTALSVASGTTLTIWTTKAGSNTVTATAGGKTATQQVFAYVPVNTARNVSITPEKETVRVNTFTSLTLKVTDVFGNPVPNVPVGTTATNPGVTLQLAGGGSLPLAVAATNASGQSTVSYTAGQASGTAQISAVGLGYQFGTAISGGGASVSTAASTITVEGATPSRSIVIVGERTTVSGKSGILVEGVVQGIENGKTVKPFIRFPGQTTFTEGTARPVIQAGDFTWQRKTGKRVTVYVTSDDGAVVSNRVTIQAS